MLLGNKKEDGRTKKTYIDKFLIPLNTEERNAIFSDI